MDAAPENDLSTLAARADRNDLIGIPGFVATASAQCSDESVFFASREIRINFEVMKWYEDHYGNSQKRLR
ncbi:hypothetical protein F441_07179 [Phytophthora nicotianae CJ01A1]|uniref:Uncharacterized protein n=6 Tax=Phytophthora nicotianae TaxID=4792 RepID=W2QBU8_PHYN3|nr:hypothetical protein PPTG_22670 [Phytophthora nicotianae INRA-310]ETI48859.1 hypothetical protein F443_07163 [Phytophthora nicotianae P1569]ETK88739.1 hypothetical protein L915_07050 [Phytophthora nicotianae]ETO77597.1 hypothetical protein F444_07234 [Phytophthora nicotianae P1976]ETP18623.1 hypothetical protein F441_07179 [Phytophthora nicotianae CJ01A1]ETP46532.1 hypothetical protein F442_07237 [Phytophthora nicotianae P10297]